MKDIAIISEEINHHPTWTNTYNKLDIILQTHDTGGLSELDYLLARKIDQLYNQLK
jgi:4a-hydroxytetrahydrobiopterin dehydratase